MRKILCSKSLQVDTVASPGSIDDALYSLKRDLILFDQIVFPNLNNRLRFIYDIYKRNFGSDYGIKVQEFEYLQSNSLVKDYDLIHKLHLTRDIHANLDEDNRFLLETYNIFAGSFAERFKYCYQAACSEKNPVKRMHLLNQAIFNDNIHDGAASLILTEHLKYYDKAEAINSQPVQRGGSRNKSRSQSVEKPTVYSILLKDLELPSDSTPWQDITDYRKEPDSQRRLAQLRVWLNKVVKESYTENELVDEYDAFYLDFSAAIKRHRIKTKKTWLKILIVGSAEIIEDAFKLRLKNIVEKVFNKALEVNTELVELSEAEANAPGKELAYIFFSKETFGK